MRFVRLAMEGGGQDTRRTDWYTPGSKKAKTLQEPHTGEKHDRTDLRAREGISSPPGYIISQARLPDTTIPHKNIKNFRNESFG